MKLQKTTLIYILLFFCTNTFLFAQDILILQNNEVQKVKILEILESEIIYKKYSNLNGPLYRVNRSDVSNIIYENGTSESFNVSPEIQTSVRKQVDNRVVGMRIGFWGVGYTIDGRKASGRDVSDLMRSNQNAYNLFKKGRSIKTLSGIFSATGWIMLLGGAGAYGASDKNPAFIGVMGTGGVFIILSAFVFSPKAKKLLEVSINKYNLHNSTSTLNKKLKMSFGLSNNGITATLHL